MCNRPSVKREANPMFFPLWHCNAQVLLVCCMPHSNRPPRPYLHSREYVSSRYDNLGAAILSEVSHLNLLTRIQGKWQRLRKPLCFHEFQNIRLGSFIVSLWLPYFNANPWQQVDFVAHGARDVIIWNKRFAWESSKESYYIRHQHSLSHNKLLALCGGCMRFHRSQCACKIEPWNLARCVWLSDTPASQSRWRERSEKGNNLPNKH